jgi:ADP-ribosylglycohydrolase
MAIKNEERLNRALISLDGLSVGDAFGEKFFAPPEVANHYIINRIPPDALWRWTDDTNMALSIVSVLRQCDEVDQDRLALRFANRYHPSRGYGPAMHGLLPLFAYGASWREAAPALFSGQGSFGNGAAMRVAPVGAYFADDLEATAEHARRSAEVTHAHPEAAAGAIAVAVGVAVAWQIRGQSPRPTRQEFIGQVIPSVPQSAVRAKLEVARDLGDQASVSMAADKLGNGSRITAQDTVPYVLWCAGQYLDNYQEALWQTVKGGGDMDTTCAMVGGIVAMYTGREGIPEKWLHRREKLPDWHLNETDP